MRLKCAGSPIAVPRDFPGDVDIGARIERGQQVEFLEYEANLALAHAGSFCVGERGQVVAVQHHTASVGPRQPA